MPHENTRTKSSDIFVQVAYSHIQACAQKGSVIYIYDFFFTQSRVISLGWTLRLTSQGQLLPIPRPVSTARWCIQIDRQLGALSQS